MLYLKGAYKSRKIYLVLLREVQTIIGLESLNVVGQVTNSDGRMFPHPYRDSESGECSPSQTHMHRNVCTHRVQMHVEGSVLTGRSDMR